MIRVLITGIGGPTPLGVAKSIKRAIPDSFILGVDADSYAGGFYLGYPYDVTRKVQLCSSKDYWENIKNLITEYRINFAIPIPESEVLVWAENEEDDPLGCEVLVPERRLAEFCYDKVSVAELLMQSGLAPMSVRISKSEIPDFSFPAWVRATRGAGALGSNRVDDSNELARWIDLTSERYDLVMSEFLPGRNLACTVLYKGGEFLASASAERVEYLMPNSAPSGVTGMSRLGRVYHDEILTALSKSIMSMVAVHTSTKLHGIFTIDFKEDINGNPLVTEINIRPISFNEAFTELGVNFPYIAIYPEKRFNLKNLDKKFELFFLRAVDMPIMFFDNQD